jgi:predicted metal-binding membrane protein
VSSRAEATRPAALVVVAAAAWLVLAVNNVMAADIGTYVGLWTLMMTAMMLPSIAPLVQLQRTTQGTMLLAAGYLGVWAATGFLAYAADMYVDVGAGLVLLAAAAYEVTPLKAACLRRCRAPVDFLFTRWHGGRFGALRLGLEHAVYCVGCCWALMAVLVLAAAMSLAWAAVLASIVLVQKILPLPRWSSAATAVALALAAVIVEVA